jgi:NAD(P)H-dependent FMN reductase
MKISGCLLTQYMDTLRHLLRLSAKELRKFLESSWCCAAFTNFLSMCSTWSRRRAFPIRFTSRQQSVPECTVDDLREADGVLFGSPTRYGNMSAQMKALFDSTVSTVAERARWKANRRASLPLQVRPTAAKRRRCSQ